MRRGFSLWELTLIVCFSALVTIQLWSNFGPGPAVPSWTIDRDIATAFAARFGPEHYSGGLEEYILRDYLKDRRRGVFLDVGAFHAKEGSNTYRLERDFEWTGLAIDANPEFAPEYKALRPKTVFENAFVGDEDRGVGTLYLTTGNDSVASGDPHFTEQWGRIGRTISAPKRTLDSLLRQHHIERIDFLSMDIELGEPAALRGFDIDRYHPALVTVEAHAPVRNTILEYFARHGYVLLGDYLRADSMNYWFRPLVPTVP
jgi:FkbM family methyltransferase